MNLRARFRVDPTDPTTVERRRLAVAIALPTLAVAVMLFAPLGSSAGPGAAAVEPTGTGSPAKVRITTPQPTVPAVAQSLDWADVLRVGDVTYTGALLNSGRALREEDLGAEVTHVRAKLNGNVKPAGYDMKDGDAAYLDPGTPLYAVKGYATTFRLAARSGSVVVLFEALQSPNAKVARDLLDIEGRVQSVSVDANDPRGTARSITRQEDVLALVRMVLDAPVDRSKAFGRRTAYVSFRLLDGTAVTFQYAAAGAQLSRGIVGLPAEFRTLIESP